MVHDIGKIIVPSEILNKKGKLTKNEYEIVQNHPKWAYETLIKSRQLSNLAKYVLHHHERWDGNGYPNGLKKDNIPKISQILSIADCWDAMRSNRSYRDALTYKEAKNELIRNKNKQFSNWMVEQFVDMLETKNDNLFLHE